MAADAKRTHAQVLEELRDRCGGDAEYNAITACLDALRKVRDTIPQECDASHSVAMRAIDAVLGRDDGR